MNNEIWIRPARVLVMLFGGGAVAVGGFFLYLAEGSDPWQWVMGSAVTLFGVVGFVNYMWFHYVVIDNDSLCQVKYFTLVRRRVLLRDLTSVGTRPIDTSYGVLRATPSVRFHWSDGVIELNPVAYWTGPIRKAVIWLKEQGIPVDPQLSRELGINRRAGQV